MSAPASTANQPDNLPPELVAMLRSQEQSHHNMMQQAAAKIAELERLLLQQQAQTAALAGAVAAPSAASASASAPSSAMALRIDMKPLQPSAFNGQVSSNVEQWCMEMERYFTFTGLPEQDPRRVALASTYLKDVASGWYNGAIRAHELSSSSTWSDFRAKIVQRFRRIAPARVARAALRQLRHRSRVEGYSKEFERLLQDIPDMSVTDQIEQYIYGLQRHIAAEVDRQEPTTLHAAMEMAQRVELLLATHRTASAYGPSRPSFGSALRSAPDTAAGRDGGDRMDLSLVRSRPGAYEEEQKYPTHAFEDEEGEWQGPHPEHKLHAMQGRGRDMSRRPPLRFPGLPAEEVQRRYRENRCFHCGQTGHQARQCKAQPPSSGNGSARQ